MRNLVLASLCFFLSGAPLFAFPRTFVSAAGGSDLNSCTLSSPCRSFGAAIAATDPGGEIVVLDSGGYGPFVISQAVKVEAPAGVTASITASMTNAIIVNAGAGDTILLRGLSLTGTGASAGVVYLAGGMLVLERVSLTGFSTIAVGNSGTGDLAIHEGVLIGNAVGIQADNGVSDVAVTITSSRIHSHAIAGVIAGRRAAVTVTDSVLVGNNVALLARSTTQSATARLTVGSCVLSGNANAVLADDSGDGNVIVLVNDSTIVGNVNGVFAGAGTTLLTTHSNVLDGNVTDGAFTGTFILK